MRRFTAVLCTSLGLALAACAGAECPPETPPPKAAAAAKPPVLYAVRFHPGPKWVKGAGPGGQPGIQEHVKNMSAWHARGVLVLGGPFLDGTGGLAVLRAESVEEAERLAREDPGVRAGLLAPEIHPLLGAYLPKP